MSVDINKYQELDRFKNLIYWKFQYKKILESVRISVARKILENLEGEKSDENCLVSGEDDDLWLELTKTKILFKICRN